MSEATPRRILYYVPIIHSAEDKGSLGQRLPADESFRRLAEARWAEIYRQVQTLALDWPNVKVFQDGLPETEAEVLNKIIAEVPGPNYDLLRWLVAKGAALVGTESPKLIREEYDHLQAVLTAENAEAMSKARQAYVERANALLAERDAHIAARIAETLPPAGVGLIFIGLSHQLLSHLPTDIEIREL